MKAKQQLTPCGSCKNLPALAYTVKEFCQATGISPRTFYALKAKRKAPPLTRIGRRVLIRVEAAQQWLKQKEAA